LYIHDPDGVRVELLLKQSSASSPPASPPAAGSRAPTTA
jgi:hypothetical protein